MGEDTQAGRGAPDGAPRIATLDILRGLAIVGILFMNIEFMGHSFWGAFEDPRTVGWSGVDQLFWWAREITLTGTARCLLEMLFGAGMVILTERAAGAAGERTLWRRYYVRNIVLFLFGLVHMFVLLWPGDILHTYGIAALIAFLFRRLRPRWLLAIGLFLAALQLVAGGYFGYVQAVERQERAAALEARSAAGETLAPGDRTLLEEVAKERADAAARQQRVAAMIAAEDAGRDGTFASWVRAQWRVTLDFLGKGFEIFMVLEAFSMMLVGAALFKLGIIQGDRPRAFYLRLTLAAYAAGFALRAAAAYDLTRFHGGPEIGHFTYEVARVAVTLGHIGLVNLLLARGTRLFRPFAAAGRVALSFYIAQTLLTLWLIFPPFGLALYGDLGWTELFAVALAVNALLLWLANLYVHHYAIGPVEWAWRSLIEWRLLPFRRRPGAAGLVSPAASAPPRS